MLLILSKRCDIAIKDVNRLRMRKETITGTTFNLNIFSEEQCLTDFRFRKSDIGRVASNIGWNIDRTNRNRYRCDAIVAFCVMMKRLSSACTWYELEVCFGKRISNLSEIYWECVERFLAHKGHLIEVFQWEF